VGNFLRIFIRLYLFKGGGKKRKVSKSDVILQLDGLIKDFMGNSVSLWEMLL
jgi:hypothetical protein